MMTLHLVRLRASLLPLAAWGLALSLLAGCKTKGVDEALVVFDVNVAIDVDAFQTLEFSVTDRAGVPLKTVNGETNHRSFRFGYYMPGVNGDVTILGQAKSAAGCVVGEAMLMVTGVQAGQTTTATEPMAIVKKAGSCPDAGVDHPDAGPSEGGPGDGGSASDARAGADGADRPDSGGAGGVDGGSDAPGDVPPAKKQKGDSCAAGADCASTYCVDGVCCENACDGSCEACAETATKGTCVAVMGAGTPRQGHAACAGTGTCGGMCDGADRKLCTYPATETECRAASCAAATTTATIRAVCDGKGACPAAQTVACAPNTCAGTICAGGCSDSQPCTGNNYCNAGVCTPKKANGMTCAGPAECTNGFCADGICCNSACDQPCQACNLTAAPGTCGAVKSATDDKCNGTQTCDATGACKKSSGQTCVGTTECASGACVDGRCCGVATCGTCQSCTGGGGTCVQVTSMDDDTCNGASSCDATGTCKKKTGQTCTGDTQCISAFCTDGVCCNSRCTGSCEFCNAGTCGFITNAPRANHPACAGTGLCVGTCNGTRATCTLPGAEVTCSQPSCLNGTTKNAALCDGLGNCPAPTTTGCTPFICSTTATSCFTTCTTASQCVANSVCTAGSCVTCTGSLVVCSNACVDTTSNASNCGKCGHSCQGGTCQGGKCQPVQVITSTNAGYNYTLGSGRVYVMIPSSAGNPTTTVSYMATSAPPGTALTPFATLPGASCTYIIADPTSGDLFLSCLEIDINGNVTGDQWIWRVSGTTGGATQNLHVALNQSGTVPVYPSNGNLYWGEIDIANAVLQAPFGATTMTNLTTYVAGDTVWGVIGIDQNSAFTWQTVGGATGAIALRQVSLATGVTTSLLSPFSFSSLQSDGTTVFYNVGGAGIYSLPKGVLSTTVNTVLSDTSVFTMGPVDATQIYYGGQVDAVTGATGCTSYRIARKAKTGAGAEEALVNGVDNCVTSLKGDANVVVWRGQPRGCATVTCSYPLLKLAK